MDKVTPDDLMTFLWVCAALVAFTLAVWGLVDKIKNARKPAENIAEWRRSVEQRLANDKARIDSIDEGQKGLCHGVLALLNHELHNGNSDEMEKAKKGIYNYLIER